MTVRFSGPWPAFARFLTLTTCALVFVGGCYVSHPDDGGAGPICVGLGCPSEPEPECFEPSDCPALGPCTAIDCRGGLCVREDDDSLCSDGLTCVAGLCVGECCASDSECPTPPPFGCARASCSACVCDVVPDDALCGLNEICSPDSIECVETRNIAVVLRTDYIPGAEFREVQVEVDARAPTTFIASPELDFYTGQIVGQPVLWVGAQHLIRVSLRLENGETVYSSVLATNTPDRLTITIVIARQPE